MLTGEPERKLRRGRLTAPGALLGRPSRRAHPRDQRFAVVHRRLERRRALVELLMSMCTPPPENVGSGKLGTPCERMQAAALRYCCCCAGVTWRAFPGPPPGRSLRQAPLRRLEVGSRRRRREPHLDADFTAVFADLGLREVGHSMRVHAGGVRDRLAPARELLARRWRRPPRASRRSATPMCGAQARHACVRGAAATARQERAGEEEPGSGQARAKRSWLCSAQRVARSGLACRLLRSSYGGCGCFYAMRGFGNVSEVRTAQSTGEYCCRNRREASLPRVRVLVIEDDEEMAEAIAFGLRQAGMAVDVALDGPAGLVRARGQRLRRDRARPRPAGDARRRAVRDAGARSSVAAAF